MVGVVQAVGLVIGSELDAAEIVVVPQPIANRDRDVPLLASHFDRFVAAGMEQSSGAGNSQRGFERGVVDIAGAAELGIVRITPHARIGAHQVEVGVNNRRGVQVPRPAVSDLRCSLTPPI